MARHGVEAYGYLKKCCHNTIGFKSGLTSPEVSTNHFVSRRNIPLTKVIKILKTTKYLVQTRYKEIFFLYTVQNDLNFTIKIILDLRKPTQIFHMTHFMFARKSIKKIIEMGLIFYILFYLTFRINSHFQCHEQKMMIQF